MVLSSGLTRENHRLFTESETLAPLCSIDGKPSAHYLSCVEDSILAIGNPDMEQATLKKFPRFETQCNMLSEELLARNQTSFDDFKTSSPEQHYLNSLKTNPDRFQRVPQYRLANHLGIKPESLRRIRKRLAGQDKN